MTTYPGPTDEESGGQDNEGMDPETELEDTSPAAAEVDETAESMNDAQATFRPGWMPGVNLG